MQVELHGDGSSGIQVGTDPNLPKGTLSEESLQTIAGGLAGRDRAGQAQLFRLKLFTGALLLGEIAAHDP
jgi:hypothetical protein